MKKIFTTLLVAAALMMGITAKAQVKFGVKGGVNVTSMSFNNSVFDASNRTGVSSLAPPLRYSCLLWVSASMLLPSTTSVRQR